ncbi:MAG: choice-of-anchor Q domain-containing protein [Limisphaerales bacterium]
MWFGVALSVAAVPAFGNLIYVNASAPTNSPPDGQSWATAFLAPQAGLSAAQAGDEVWVAAGTYFATSDLPGGNFAVTNGVALYGGFSGSETNRDQRNWTKNLTILDGRGLYRVVTVAGGATNTTRVDGFTIRNGKAGNGGGIYFTNASPVIAHNLITQNTAFTAGGGIYCKWSEAVIVGNQIVQNGFADGAGIYCDFSSVTISNNLIAANGPLPGQTPGFFGGGIADEYGAGIIVSNRIFGNVALAGGGIFCFNSTSQIAFNLVADNQAQYIGGGIESNNSFAKIHNNRIAGNVVGLPYSGLGGGGLSCFGTAAPQFYNNLILSNRVVGGTGGGAIYCGEGTTPVILNNTLLHNRSPAAGGGIYNESINRLRIANNLIAFGSSGVYSAKALDFGNNDVFGNGTNDFSGFADPTGSNRNVSIDPQLIENDEFLVARLQPTSPCVDSGDGSVVEPDWVGLDGQPRVQGAAVDIGADESDGSVPSPIPQIVRVSPAGNDANAGASWSQAKRTVQAAADQAAQTGGEVWVASGFYPENIQLRMFTALYGGFGGTETNRAERNWMANPTILDGQQSGSVLTALWIDRFGAVDGFTMQNGQAAHGGGIFCVGSPIRIQFNTIDRNTAANGGGIACLEGAPSTLTVPGKSPWPTLALPTPYLADNRITGNRAIAAGTNFANGAGVYLRSAVALVNNLIARNVAQNPPAELRSRVRPAGVALEDFGQYAAAAGIFCDPTDFLVTIANNTVVRNQVDGPAPQGTAGGIYAYAGAGSLNNLTNSVIANNVIAFNSSGLIFWPSLSQSGPVLHNNCLFGNETLDYGGGPALFGTNGNLSVDPLVAGPPDDVHEFTDSPCIDAGDDTIVQTNWLDIDGLGRRRGLHVDIGASEIGWPHTWQPVMLGTDAVPIQIVTAGGITYARYTVTYGGCERLVGVGPAVRAGTNLSCDFDLQTEVGVLCPDLVIKKQGVAVLGALAPGDYTFTTAVWGRLVTTLPFTVSTNTMPTLVPVGRTVEGSFQMEWNGIAGVDYVLQASADLVDWTSLSTNRVGTPLIDDHAGAGSTRFYRLRIGP